ncbi:MAG: hypothetical protein KC503_02875 [Myxococcales bacterium]|nr:hypothetical protein [Myxococcales bacterium]
MNLSEQLQAILAESGADAQASPVAFVGDAKLARQVASAARSALLISERFGRRRKQPPVFGRVAALAAALPLAPASLSALISLRVACRAEQPEALVGSWCRLLHVGARLILVEPSAGGGVLAAMRRMGSEAMDREDVAALLLESGLAPVSQCQVGSLSVTWGVVTEATAMRQGQSARG